MPGRNSNPSNPKLKPSAVEEWDFSHCPEDELKDCCYYEYSREREETMARVAMLRDPKYLPDNPYPGDAIYYWDKWFTTFFRLFAEYPSTPWLKITPANRRVRLKECARWDSPFMSVSPERLQNDDDLYPYFPMDVGVSVVHSVHAVEVDWTASNDALKKAFDQWLIDNRPKYEIHLDQTGRISDRELLKYLGAYRLLRDAENDWEKANTWAEKLGHGTHWTPRYSDARAWARPKRQAKQMIERGTTSARSGSLLKKLDLSKLDEAEKVRVKIQLGQMDRAESRRLAKMEGEAALAEMLARYQRQKGGA